MNTEIKALTGLRGVAAFYVILFHCLSIDPVFRENVQKFEWVYAIGRHGYLAVDVFFVLSGFVVTLSSQAVFTRKLTWINYRQFLIKRFIRIYPLYIVSTIAAFYLLSQWHKQQYDTLRKNFFFLQILSADPYVLPPTWSLCTEWIMYLLFLAIAWLVYRRNKPYWYWVLAFLCVATLALAGYFHPSWFNWNNESVDNVHVLRYDITKGPAAIVRCFGGFMAGVLAFRLYHLSNKFSSFSFPVAVAGLMVLLFNQADLLFICLMPFFILSVTHGNGVIASILESRPIYYLGKISYSLYLLHFFLIYYRGYLELALSKISPFHAAAISYAISVILLFCISSISYYFIEKQFSQLLRSVLLHKQATSFDNHISPAVGSTISNSI